MNMQIYCSVGKSFYPQIGVFGFVMLTISATKKVISTPDSISENHNLFRQRGPVNQ